MDFEKTKNIYYELMRRQGPYMALLEITNACNGACPNCGLASGKTLEGELNTVELKETLDQLKGLGTRYLLIMGGEPTIRKDLLEIISYATGHNMYVAIGTNGSFIRESYARSLKRAGLKSVKLSLDSHDEKINDASRYVGAYRDTLEAIAACKAVGILDISVGSMVFRKNCESSKETLNFVIAELGVAFEAAEFFPFGRGKGKEDLLLTKEQRCEIQRYMFAMQKKFGRDKVLFEDKYIICEDTAMQEVYATSNVLRGCKAGTFGIVITAVGDILACPHLRVSAGNIRVDKISDVWNNSELFKSLRARGNIKGKCNTCEYLFVCGGCRSSAYLFTGDALEADPLCWAR